MTTIRDAKGLRKVVGNPAPTLRADINSLATDIEEVGNRKLGPTTLRTSETVAGRVWEGLEWADTTDGRTYQRRSSAWIPFGTTGWTTYTPTLTNIGFGTGGNAALVAKWRYIGNLVEVDIRAVFGTTGTTPPNSPTFTLPVTAVAPKHRFQTYSGLSSALDSSAVATVPIAVLANDASTTTFTVYTFAGAGFANLTTTAPFIWALDDVLSLNFQYEAA